MEAFELVRIGFTHLAQPTNLALALGGTFLGIVFGVIPGLTGTICLVLLLPITYAMEPLRALVLMGAVYCGSVFGGAISAITLNIPGTPEAVCTTFDGYTMAKQGKAGKAIGAAVESSALGGFASVLVLLLVGPVMASWALRFGSAEYFSLILMGLCCVSGISGESLTKGFIAMLIGVLVGIIGTESMTEVERFTFHSTYLSARLQFVAVVIGTFAISEFLVRFEEPEEMRSGYAARPEWMTMREFWRLRKTVGVSGILGYVCGAIPGMGATLASFLGYGVARAISKDRARFGTGLVEGVVAPETANNAATGGAMLPLLTVGIPGGTQTAIMLGVLLLHGIRVGPGIFYANQDLVAAACSSMLIANLLMLGMGFYLARVFAGILRIKWGYLVTVTLVFCFIGAYSLRALSFDVYTAIVFGIVAYFMRRGGFPLPPFILAVILSPMLEEKFLTTMLMSGNNLLVFVTRPISLALLIFALAILVLPLIRGKEIMTGGTEKSKTASLAELIWLWVLIGVGVYVFVSAFSYIDVGQSVLNSAALWPWLSSGAIVVLSAVRMTCVRSSIKRSMRSGPLLGRKDRNVLIGGFWLALYIVGEMIIGHIFAGLLILPFLLRFSGITDRRLILGVPSGLVVITTLLFTLAFYLPLPVGMGVFRDVQTSILSWLAAVVR